jgi:hypothetical protein
VENFTRKIKVDPINFLHALRIYPVEELIMTTNISCAECERAIRSDTARLCIICNAPSHSICVSKSGRVDSIGQYYCPDHEKIFKSAQRKEKQRKIMLDRHSALRKNLLESEESDASEDNEIKEADNSKNVNVAGRKRKRDSKDESEGKFDDLEKISLSSDVSEFPDSVQKSSPKIVSHEKSKENSLSQQKVKRRAFVNESNAANVAHRCALCKGQMTVPLKNFQKCIMCSEVYHKSCLGVDLMNSVSFFTCTDCKKNIDDERQRREKENKRQKEKENRKENAVLKVKVEEKEQEDLLWYITNREKFERMRERFELSQQKLSVSSQRVLIPPSSAAEQNLRNANANEIPESNNSLNTSKSMEQIMLEMCQNQAYALRRQAEMDERERQRILPQVKSLGAEWITFYKSYQASKYYFEPQENVVRLQAAILCPEILRKGGTNLFCTETFDETLREINESMNNSKRLVCDGAEKLKKLKSPKDHIYDKQVLIDFIVEIRHFANLLERIGDVGSQNDTRLIATLASRLPWNLNASWQEKCHKRESQGEPVTMKFLSDFLQLKLGGLERSQMEMNLIIWQNEKSSSREAKSGKFFTHQPEKQAWEYRCWVDKSDEHNIRDCDKAKTMSGRECFLLAKQLRVCTSCGKERFTGQCSRSTSPPQCPKHPGQKHWQTVCPSRQATESSKAQSNAHSEKEDEAISDSEEKPASEEAHFNAHQASSSRVIDPRHFFNFANTSFKN